MGIKTFPIISSGVGLIATLLVLNMFLPRLQSWKPVKLAAREAPATVTQRAPSKHALIATVGILLAVDDPDSVSVDEALVTENAVCITFRATNSVNGVTRSNFVVTRDFEDGAFGWEKGFTAKWDSQCTNQSATDVTETVRAFISARRLYLR